MAELAIEGKYGDNPPNEPILLYSGPIQVSWAANTVEANAHVYFHWFPYPHVGFTASIVHDWGDPDLPGDVKIELLDVGGAAEASLIRQSTGVEDPDLLTIEGTVHGEILVGNPCPTEFVQFHVANLPTSRGTMVQAGPNTWMGRLATSMGPFEVVLDAVRNARTKIEALSKTTGFAITHVGRIRRTDGDPVQFEDVESLSEKLHWWLSLLRGERTGPLLWAGVHEDVVPWEVWSGPIIESWTNRLSWMPSEVATEVFDGGNTLQVLHTLLGDAEVGSSIRRAIDWYTQSVSNSHAASRVVAAQTGLELMSSLKLTHDVQISSDGFGKMTVSDALRLTLSYASISADIPAQFAELATAAAAGPGGQLKLDGPGAITEIRNGVVHSKLQTRFGSVESIQGSVLAVRYLELLLLHRLGYEGQWMDRAGWQLTAPPWVT